MTAHAIEIQGLRKVYRRLRKPPRVAVDGLDLAVPEGCVFGFLGPNGSGKTTTIRCLLGHVRPTAGSLALLGACVPDELQSVIDRVGAIVETPALFPTMTGRRNLELLAPLAGRDRREVRAVLERVGLADRGDDLVRGYSLGMRQRLGIAAALLKDPALLVLDEPANGLDPAGIREVRFLLRELAAEGRTVLVSSHLLGEVAQTCDHLAILRRGRCVETGSVAELLARAGRPSMRVRVDDPVAGARTLIEAGFVAAVAGGAIDVDAAPERGPDITRALAAGGHWVAELTPIAASLEDLFLDLTADEPGTDAPVEVAA
jgi:ABC-2 type transport system ATP-binding protein